MAEAMAADPADLQGAKGMANNSLPNSGYPISR
jgi:hypothetical protein